MKNQKYIWPLIIIAILAAWFFIHRSPIQMPSIGQTPPAASQTTAQTVPAVSNTALVSPSFQTTAAAVATNDSYVHNPQYPPGIMERYRSGQITKGEAIQETMMEKNNQSRDFYGKVIDQDGNPLANVSVIGELVLNNKTYGSVELQKYNTTTDSGGLFEFTGLHGAGLGITISKPGYENEWKNDAYENPSGGQSSPSDRAIYRMWSTNIHEQLITGNKSFKIVPDGRPYFIDLTTGSISESGTGDLKVWIQYTNQPVRGQLYDWSAGIEVIKGGLSEMPQAAINSGFLEEPSIPMYSAPENGYTPSFQLQQQIKGGQSGEIGNRYFYLLLNDGKEYGKMSINLFAPYNDKIPGMIRLSYAINPSGSRILR